MAIREGKWKCTYCAAVNRGQDLACAGCGSTREADVEFFCEDDAPEVTEEQAQAIARGGADWTCETCGTSNRSQAKFCAQCAAPRGASVQREEKYESLDSQASRGASQPASAQGFAARPTNFNQPQAVPSRRFFTTKVGLMAAAAAVIVFVFGILAIGGLAYYLTHTHETELTVTSVDWKRTVEVEELQTLREQKWEDEVPADARVIDRRREIHSYTKVQTGTKSVTENYTERVQTGTKKVKTGRRNLGNGYFEDVYSDQPVYENKQRTRTVEKPTYRDDPVYKMKVTYDVDRWRTTRTAETAGQDNNPVWAQIPQGAKARAGKRTEKYLVRLRDESSGKAYEQEVAGDVFARFMPGSHCRALINNMGTLTELTPPNT